MTNYLVPKHYCGIFGVWGAPNAAELTFYGLHALQHRGQESAGIASFDGQLFHSHRGMGLVSQVFNDQVVASLKGQSAIGHTRYSTTGSSELSNAQPLVVNCAKGWMGLAHNGNLTNAENLRKRMEDKGFIFQTTVDSEIILCLLAQPGATLKSVCHQIEGAYSIVLLTENELIGARDPLGFRPLVLGQLRNAWVLASETCALDLVGASFVRDVEPGEMVIIDSNGLTSKRLFPAHANQAFCIFEYVYFARPDSIINSRNVYEVRLELGRQLAREHPRIADLVAPVPDSGNSVALGYAQASGLPYEMIFVRNHYIGRSFLQPTQLARLMAAKIKLNLIKQRVKGKRVILVDDSIVRGTTCIPRIQMLREAGASEIHLLISCPPHRFACPYGIDLPERRDLIAARKSLPQIERELKVDSLGYLSEQGMAAATGLPMRKFCMACYNGKYPVPFPAKLSQT